MFYPMYFALTLANQSIKLDHRIRGFCAVHGTVKLARVDKQRLFEYFLVGGLVSIQQWQRTRQVKVKNSNSNIIVTGTSKMSIRKCRF